MNKLRYPASQTFRLRPCSVKRFSQHLYLGKLFESMPKFKHQPDF